MATKQVSLTSAPGRWAPCIAALATMGSVLLGTGPARANITIGTDVERGTTSHDETGFRYYISQADCEKNDTLTFSVSRSVFTSPLEVWVTESGDCTASDARQGNSPVCTKLFADATTNKDISVVLSVADLAKAITKRSDCSFDASGGTQPRAAKLYFIINDASNPITTYKLWEQAKVDLAGPSAPTDIKAETGGSSLMLSFDTPSEADVAGYFFFCEEITGSTGTGGGSTGAGGSNAGGSNAGGSNAGGSNAGGSNAGGSNAGGAGTGGSGGASDCTSQILTQGAVVVAGSDIDKLRCGGLTSGTSAKGETDELKTGVTYAVAVAAYDDVDNIGKLSAIACGVPVPVDDFFKKYREAGGQAGGGICSIGGASDGGTALFFGGVAGALALGFRRSTRNSNREGRR